jgi:uncharacterized GH25 family protein
MYKAPPRVAFSFMTPFALSLVFVVLAAVPAPAHFIWIVPYKNGATAKVVFSEIPEPDDPKYLDKITRTQLYLRGTDGKDTLWAWTKGKEAFQVTVPHKGPRMVGAVCSYGVLLKEGEVPYLLRYYAKACLPEPGHEGFKPLPSQAWERLPLEIVQAEGKDLRQFKVLWQGKPLAGAEVAFLPPGNEKLEKRKTSKEGIFDAGSFKAGVYGFRAKHVEVKDGEHDGKKYREIRHYSTVVVELPGKKQ